jgi:hypothetical protein
MTCDEYKAVRARMIEAVIADQSASLADLCTNAEAKAIGVHLASCEACDNLLGKGTRDRIIRENPEIELKARHDAARKKAQMLSDPECQ